MPAGPFRLEVADSVPHLVRLAPEHGAVLELHHVECFPFEPSLLVLQLGEDGIQELETPPDARLSSRRCIGLSDAASLLEDPGLLIPEGLRSLPQRSRLLAQAVPLGDLDLVDSLPKQSGLVRPDLPDLPFQFLVALAELPTALRVVIGLPSTKLNRAGNPRSRSRSRVPRILSRQFLGR